MSNFFLLQNFVIGNFVSHDFLFLHFFKKISSILSLPSNKHWKSKCGAHCGKEGNKLITKNDGKIVRLDIGSMEYNNV